ncbi:hypothetical protein [Nonomuraea sp. NPDC048901]|uniref:hypothetical protein n=1 Tax=Nonomuraea sp. NPDC048901 TaxID=3155627 RepID=UPI0033E8013D
MSAHWQGLLAEHGKAYFDTDEDIFAEQAKLAREITNSLVEACAFNIQVGAPLAATLPI